MLCLKERIELERQQAIRDILLKRDIARWLQAKMVELEQGLEQAPQDKVLNHSEFKNGDQNFCAETLVISWQSYGLSFLHKHINLGDQYFFVKRFISISTVTTFKLER